MTGTAQLRDGNTLDRRMLSFCQELCTPGSRGVLCYPQSILTGHALHDRWQGMRGPKPMPPLGGTLLQFAYHRQPRHAGAAAAGLVGASTDSGKRRVAGMGRPDGPPRLGGEIIKRQ